MRWWIIPTIVTTYAVGCSVKTQDVDDDGTTSQSSTTTAGSGGSGGATSTGTGAYGGGCEGLCAKVGDAMCPNDTEASCTTECQGLYQTAPQCEAEIDELVSCQVTSGDVVCEPDGDAKVEGCDTEGQAFFTCLMGGTTGACYENAGDCNPLTDSCAAGQACDIAEDNLCHCFPPPNDAPVGSPCNVSSGPYCQHGSTCNGGICRAYCCDDTDCTIGTCQTLGTVGSVELRACM